MEKTRRQRIFLDFGVSIICLLLAAILIFTFIQFKTPRMIESEGFNGDAPVTIYKVYDEETGVYYAVTDRGGICVMETMDGSTKLLNEGEPPVVHKNTGNNE